MSSATMHAPTLPAAGTWIEPAATIAAALAQPTLVPLDELGVIEADGADATAFLHGQLTNRVEGLETDRFQLNGYCSPKGRLLATFHHWRDGERHALQLPRELVPQVARRLSMFVLRAKAKVRDASPAWRAFGVIGAGADALLASLGLSAPATPWRKQVVGATLVARLPTSAAAGGRVLLMLPTADADELTRRWQAARGAIAPSSAPWWWSEIDSGVPTVFAATQERFVPQMINFEVLGGVDFKKGCYPGQEVVARSQYRGALRRRTGIAHAAAARIGQDLYPAGGATGEPIGLVVMAASAPGGGMDLLFESSDATVPLRIADGGDLTVRPLPYPLVDVT